MAPHLIEIEATPNPNALRVLPGIRFWNAGPPIEVRVGEASADAPLAEELLGIAGLSSVMIWPDFVTVVRASAQHDWANIRPRVLGIVGDFVLSGTPAVTLRPRDEEGASEEDMIVSQIREVLERFVRPQLARDGGDATLVSFDAARGIAQVRMGGACGGCPSGITTLKGGIEKTIKQYVPEVVKVEATTEEEQSDDPKARFRQWIKSKWG